MDFGIINPAGQRGISDPYSFFYYPGLLPKPGIKWKRASPTLCIQDKEKARKIKRIEKALQSANAEHSVFYVDEADVDLNPRIGSFWSVKGQQTRRIIWPVP